MLEGTDRKTQDAFISYLLKAALENPKHRAELTEILGWDEYAVRMHNLHTSGAVRSAIGAAARRIADGKDYSPMWVRPFFWNFKGDNGSVSPIAKYRAAYNATVPRRRKAQVEEWPWHKQEVFDEVDETRLKAAQMLIEASSVIRKQAHR